MKIAGLDIGKKRIGISISDFSLKFAHAKHMIERKKFFITSKSLLKIFCINKISLVVVGLPLNMNGSRGPRAQATHDFIKNIIILTDLPFLFWDERLSTIAAKRNLVNFHLSRKKYLQCIDSESAVFILQGALDYLRILKENSFNI